MVLKVLKVLLDHKELLQSVQLAHKVLSVQVVPKVLSVL